MLLLAVPVLAQAQQSPTQFSVGSSLLATDNVDAAPIGQERADALLTLAPELTFNRAGAGLRAAGTLRADFVTSLRGKQADRVLPGAQVAAEATLIEQWLAIDANATVRQVEANPYGLRVEQGTTQNTRNAATWSVSPKLNRRLAQGTVLEASHTVSRTRYADTLEGDVDSRSSVVRVDTKPSPMGGTVEWSEERSDFAADTAEDYSDRRLLGTLNYSPDIDWVLGAVAGREQAKLDGRSATGNVHGLRVLWSPSPRTAVAAAWDRRFFGNGWQLSATHRTPWMALTASSRSEPVVAGAGLARGQTLAGFLDAILTTRLPGSEARAAAVQDILDRGGTAALAVAANTTAAYAQLRTSTNVGWVFYTPRTTLSVSGYLQRTVRLQADSLPATAAPADANDSRQKGFSVSASRRIAPQLALTASAGVDEIDGLAARLGQRARQYSARTGTTFELSPRTRVSFEVRGRHISSSVQDLASLDERAALLGLVHRF